MGRHALDTDYDTPAADWFLTPGGTPALSIDEYRQSYDRRRQYAAHAPARYASWHFLPGRADSSTLWHNYREPAWDEPGSFYDALARSASMISTSDGWEPNRAAFIYAEAYAEHEARER